MLAPTNVMAYLALFGYPLVALVLFRRLPLHAALIWTILLGYLFLPERVGYNLPMVPTFDKALIPSLTAMVMVWLTLRRQRAETRLREARAPGGDAGRSRALGRNRSALILNLLLGLFVLSPLLYYFGNQDTVRNGARFLRGIAMYDVASLTMTGLIMIMPFLLARRHLASPEAQRYLLFALVAGALVYTMLMLFEMRMSPQLHRWVYGFHAHSFGQTRRGGGFRPTVFLTHGLRVAIFVAMAILAALALWRARSGTEPKRWLAAAVWIFAVLFLAHSLGAFLLVLVLAPAVIFLGVRGQLVVAAVVAGVVMLYPMLRGADLVPTDRLVEVAADINTDRAASLAYRFDNENMLLARANEKPFFGWGAWGRNLLYSERDGRSIAIPDGVWVIIMGTQGWVGYLATFGLACMPLILIAWRQRQIKPDMITAGLAMVLAINLIDMLPNSSLVPVTWLIAGALMGRYEQGRAAAAAPVASPARAAGAMPGAVVADATETPDPAPPPGRRSVYTRQLQRRSS